MYFRGQIILILLSSVLLGVSGSVLAEGGCPPGYYPHNVPGLRGCAPIPGYENSVKQKWVDAYGTLVWWSTDDGQSRYAYSSKYSSQISSEDAAMKRCKMDGGKDCSVAFTAVNSFIAIARDDTGQFLAIANAKNHMAKRMLLDDCKEVDHKCEIVEVVDSRGWYKTGR